MTAKAIGLCLSITVFSIGAGPARAVQPPFAKRVLEARQVMEVAEQTFDWLIAPRLTPTSDQAETDRRKAEYKQALLQQLPPANWSRAGTIVAMNCALRVHIGAITNLEGRTQVYKYDFTVLPIAGLGQNSKVSGTAAAFTSASEPSSLSLADSEDRRLQCDLGAPCICAVEGTPHGELAKLSKHTIGAFSALIKARVVDVVKEISSDATDELTVAKLRELVRDEVQIQLKQGAPAKQGASADTRTQDKQIFDRAVAAADSVAANYASTFRDSTAKLQSKVTQRLLCDPKAPPAQCVDGVDPHLASALTKELIDELRKTAPSLAAK